MLPPQCYCRDPHWATASIRPCRKRQSACPIRRAPKALPVAQHTNSAAGLPLAPLQVSSSRTEAGTTSGEDLRQLSVGCPTGRLLCPCTRAITASASLRLSVSPYSSLFLPTLYSISLSPPCFSIRSPSPRRSLGNMPQTCGCIHARCADQEYRQTQAVQK